MRIRSIIIALSLLLTACSGLESKSVETAENDLSEGNFESARLTCLSLSSDENIDGLSVDQLCRISMLMVKLAEHGEEEDCMAAATRCMKTALTRDTDSVFSFIHTLPVDEQSQTMLIQQLSNSIGCTYELNDTVPEPIY